MAQIKIGDPHGLFRVQVGLVDATGLQFGTAGPDMANGTTTSTYLIRFPKAAEIPMPDRTLIDFTGGDVWSGSYLHGITSLGTMSLTLSTIDANLISLVAESKTDQTTNTRWSIFSDNILLPTPNQVTMITTFRIQSKETGTKGADKFIHQILPRTWLSPKGISGAPNFQGAGEYQFTVVPTIGEQLPHGIRFTEDLHNFSENETPLVYIVTDNPIHFAAHRAAAGASSIITLPFPPIGAQADYASPDSTTQGVQVVVNGATVNATSIDVANRTVEVATSEGDYVGILYETNLRAPAY